MGVIKQEPKKNKGGARMNYHHNPEIAARAVHMLYCPEGRPASPEEIATRMGIMPQQQSRSGVLEEIGRRVLADPADIPAFAAKLEGLLRG